LLGGYVGAQVGHGPSTSGGCKCAGGSKGWARRFPGVDSRLRVEQPEPGLPSTLWAVTRQDAIVADEKEPSVVFASMANSETSMESPRNVTKDGKGARPDRGVEFPDARLSNTFHSSLVRLSGLYLASGPGGLP
jgi:hypothetical protein